MLDMQLLYKIFENMAPDYTLYNPGLTSLNKSKTENLSVFLIKMQRIQEPSSMIHFANFLHLRGLSVNF